MSSWSFLSFFELGSTMVRTSFSSVRKRKRQEEGRCKGILLTWASINWIMRLRVHLPSMMSSGWSSKGVGLRGRLMAFIPSSCSSDTMGYRTHWVRDDKLFLNKKKKETKKRNWVGFFRFILLRLYKWLTICSFALLDYNECCGEASLLL